MIAPKNWQDLLAQNIRSERRRLLIDQNQLAEKLGLDSRATISIWETAKGLPKMEVFEKMCIVFERTPTELMYEDLTGKSPPPKLKSVPGEEGEASKEGGRGQPTGSQLPEEDKPPKEDKEDLKEVRRQLLQLMNKVEELEHN